MRPCLASWILPLLACALTACVTEGPVVDSTKTELAEATVEQDEDLRRALPELDSLTIRYYRLLGEPGEIAQNRRKVMRPGIEGRVARHVDALLRLAADRDESARRQIAVKALSFTKDPRAVEVLSGCLGPSEDPRILTSATYALSRIRSPTTPVEPLVKLIGHPDSDVRNNTLMALWYVFEARRSAGVTVIDPPQLDTTRSLIELQLVDLYDPGVRENAAACLGALRDQRSLDPLINQLSDSDPRVRMHVALALGKLGDLRAVDPLLSRMEETPEGTPRRAVAIALAMLVEAQGIHVPERLETNAGRWARFLDEKLPDRQPVERR